MSTKIRISTNYGNTLVTETNTDNMLIPRIGEYLEIASIGYIKITKIEYYVDLQNSANNYVYVIGHDLRALT